MNALATVLPFCAQPAPKTRLSDLVREFELREGAENPDTDVMLSSILMTLSRTLVVGDLGELSMSRWAQEQLGRVLGISWDRFFYGADPGAIADELNRRLARARGTIRVRSTKEKDQGSPGVGTIRAFVSREFSHVRDSLIGNVLLDALRGVENDARVIRSAVTTMSTSFVVRLGEPHKLGGPGEVGDVWGVMILRNSGVGFSKLVASLFLYRLACKNGLVIALPGAQIIRARHRWIDLATIRDSLAEGLRGLPERLHRGARLLEDSARVEVESIEADVRAVLRSAKLPLRFVAPIMSAYAREPHPSRFGVVSAITLAAQRETPEVRMMLEAAAGMYVAQAS